MESVEQGIRGDAQRLFRARYKLNTPGIVSHITQRAAGKEPLFLDKNDYLIMLGLLKESTEKYNLQYYALCLMPNHIHILIEPGEKNLSESMRSIFSRYAAKFNRRYERRGHLFGGPYRQSVCLDNTYLLTASVYIHLNPVRAGLVEDATQYRWSSSTLYCQDNHRESFVNPSPILELVDEDGHKARREYRQILDKAIGAEPNNALEQEGAVEKFCIRLSEIFPSLFKRLGKKEKNEQAESPCLLEVTELEERLKQLGQARARSEESKRVKKYIVEQLLARGFKKTEIAQRLGISRMAVHNILNA